MTPTGFEKLRDLSGKSQNPTVGGTFSGAGLDQSANRGVQKSSDPNRLLDEQQRLERIATMYRSLTPIRREHLLAALELVAIRHVIASGDDSDPSPA
jgi:hypothetical protein